MGGVAATSPTSPMKPTWPGPPFLPLEERVETPKAMAQAAGRAPTRCPRPACLPCPESRAAFPARGCLLPAPPQEKSPQQGNRPSSSSAFQKIKGVWCQEWRRTPQVE